MIDLYESSGGVNSSSAKLVNNPEDVGQSDHAAYTGDRKKNSTILHGNAKGQARQQLDESIKLLNDKHNKDKHPFSAFRFYPDNTNFVNKDPNEKIILLLRRHPITNVGWVLLAGFMILFPAIFTVLPTYEGLPGGFQIITVLGWYLMAIAYIFEKFLSWFFNVNIITDERVFDVDFRNLVYREITDANIDQIQDVTVAIGSAIRTFFNYGNVVIQTAAQIPQIEFEAVPFPDKVARILRELRIEEEVEKIEGRVR